MTLLGGREGGLFESADRIATRKLYCSYTVATLCHVNMMQHSHVNPLKVMAKFECL